MLRTGARYEALVVGAGFFLGAISRFHQRCDHTRSENARHGKQGRRTGYPVRTSAWFIPGVSPIRNHNVYRKVLVDRLNGKRACHYEEGVTAYQTFEVWPSDLRQTLEKAGIHKISLPPWEEGCSDADAPGAAEGQSPVITSPQPDIQYRADADSEIGFSASVDGDVHIMYWFIGNEYLGTSEPGKTLLWKSRPGKYRVRVVDDRGRSDMTNMAVTLMK